MSAPATPPDAVQELTTQLSSGVQLNDNQDPKTNSEAEITNQPDQDQNDVPETPTQPAPTHRDDNNNTVEKNKIWCRLLIPSKVAGAIIGKGGATIKSLREEFNAIINIPEARAPERVLKICVTSREKLDLLISRIAEILKDEILKSGIRRKEGETELRILVQSSQAGAIIGTKGTTVKTLRESTGSRININPECCPNSTERVAAIMGRPETVVKCISMIYDILDKVPPKGSEQRYDPNCFDPNYDYGGFGYDPRARPYLHHPAFPFVHHPGNFGPRTEQYAPVYPGPGQYGGNGSQPTYGNRFQPPNATNPPEFVPSSSHQSTGPRGQQVNPRGGQSTQSGQGQHFNQSRGVFNSRQRGPGPR